MSLSLQILPRLLELPIVQAILKEVIDGAGSRTKKERYSEERHEK